MLRGIPKSYRLMMCLVGQARPHEQGIRQAVQVVQASLSDRILAVECHKSAFGPATDGTCSVGPIRIWQLPLGQAKAFRR